MTFYPEDLKISVISLNYFKTAELMMQIGLNRSAVGGGSTWCPKGPLSDRIFQHSAPGEQHRGRRAEWETGFVRVSPKDKVGCAALRKDPIRCCLRNRTQQSATAGTPQCRKMQGDSTVTFHCCSWTSWHLTSTVIWCTALHLLGRMYCAVSPTGP